MLKGLDRSVEQAATDLLEVVGGQPRLLAQAGLTAALRSAAGTSPLPVELVSSGLGRYSADVELALYFCCMEALQNVAKHAAAHAVVIELHGDDRSVIACVSDDGRGFDVQGSSEGGLAHMAERIKEVGGALSIRSEPPGRDDGPGRDSSGSVGVCVMRAPTARRLAWSMFTATAVLATAHGVLVVSGPVGLVDPEAGLNSFPIITLGCVLGALIGALIAARQPRNPIGWLFLVGQFGTAIGLVSQAYAFRVLQDGALGPPLAGQLATVVASALGASWALSVLAAVFLLFPDGSLPSRRWRAVLWALPVPQVAIILSTVLAVPIDSIARADELSPLVSSVGVVSAMVSVLLLLLSLVALVQRLHRSRGEQRQQLRWLTAAAFALVAGFVLANLVGLGSDDTQVWAVVPLFVAYACVPVAAGVAILRYHLYDIDLVINRAVVGAAVVIFVTLGYVTAVVLLGALVGGRVSEEYWASVLATALVALAFQPLRRGVQRLGDRAVYGRKAAPYQALADLCRRLARAVSLEQVLPGIAEVSGRSIGAAHATVRLAVAGADDVVAHWPTPAAPERPVRQRRIRSRCGRAPSDSVRSR